MRFKTKLYFAALALALQLLLLDAGCTQPPPPKLTPDMAALQSELSRRYVHRDIEVLVQNSSDLVVTFVNSRYGEMPDASRAELAKDVGVFVTNHYASIDKVNTVWVSFVARETFLFVFNYSEVSAYQFDKNYLLNAGLVHKRSEAVVKAKANYLAQQDATTVLVNSLQLYGDLNKGLVLIPSFSVRGKKIVAPEAVELEFASYDDRKVFASSREITITVDKKIVHFGTARLVSTGKTAEGYVSEFLAHRITYVQFLQVVAGRDVELRLGPKVVKLTPEHLGLLRQMKECVDAAKCE